MAMGEKLLYYTGRLEQFQLEAARFVTGLRAYASLSSLYAENGWEKLNNLIPDAKSESCHFFII